jgi:hypothetical protein
MRHHSEGDENKHCFKNTHGVILFCVLKPTTQTNSLLKSFK